MRRGGAPVFVMMMLASASAFAADDAGPGDDPETLLTQLQQEYTSLSTQDCATACKALASIRRAADKICGLEPGPRCVDARSKADDAQRRVQAACPDCAIAAAPPKDDERRATQYSTPATVDSKVQAESAPRRGGCASCSTPGEKPTGDLGVVILGAFAVARLLTRRRRDQT
jgi:MYXO-CTERM domain-containing protein